MYLLEFINCIYWNSLITFINSVRKVHNSSIIDHFVSKYNSLEDVSMLSLVSKKWVDMLEEEASNLDFDGHDDMVQSTRMSGRPHNNASIITEKTFLMVLLGLSLML